VNILFIGSSGELSTQPLKRMIDSKYTLSAIACDRLQNNEAQSKNDIIDIPLYNLDSDSVSALAQYHNIPLIELSKDYEKDIPAFKALNLDLIIVSCYARKLPESILNIPKLGSVNLHPSMLPAYRGSTPLFWQYRAGEKNLSISLHKMTNEFDAGNIIAQKNFSKPDGISVFKAMSLIADVAGDLLLNSLKDFEQNKVNEIKQNNTLSSYQHLPVKKDYFISTQWSAQRIYNFIYAFTLPDVIFICVINDVTFKIVRALSFNNEQSLNQTYRIDNGQITLNCTPGIIQCQLAKDPL